jgi:hypothetical protein
MRAIFDTYVFEAFQSVASSVTFDTVSSSCPLSALETSTADSDSLAAISDTLSDLMMPIWISLIVVYAALMNIRNRDRSFKERDCERFYARKRAMSAVILRLILRFPETALNLATVPI